MARRDLERRYALLSALRWLPIGLGLPFLTLLPLARGLSLSAVGAVLAVHGLLILVLEVPSGALADTIGRKRTLLAGGLLTTLAVALFGAATSVVAFAAAMAILGVGRALISGALEAWFVDAVRAADPDAPLRGGIAGGLALNGVALGGGALVAGALPLLFDDLPVRGDELLLRYSPAFVLAAIAGLVYVVAVALLVDEPRPPAPDPEEVGRRFGADLREVLRTAAVESRRSPVVRLVLAVAFTLGFALSSWELLWQPRLADIVEGAADDTLLFGALAAAGMLVGALGVMAGVRIAARAGAGRTYVGGMLATALALALLSATTAEVPFIAAYVAVAIGMSIGEPIHQEFLHEAVGDRARATLVSLESLVLQTGAIASNLGLAALADAAGIGVAWLVAAGVLVVGAGLAARVARAAA